MKKLLRALSYILVALVSSGLTLGGLALTGQFEPTKLEQLQSIIE